MLKTNEDVIKIQHRLFPSAEELQVWLIYCMKYYFRGVLKQLGNTRVPYRCSPR